MDIQLSHSNNRDSFRVGSFEEIGAPEKIEARVNKELDYKLKLDNFDGGVPLREFLP